MNVQQKADILLKRYEENHQGEEWPEGQTLFGVFKDGVMTVEIDNDCRFIDVYTDTVYHFDQQIFEPGEVEENMNTLGTEWAGEDEEKQEGVICTN